MCFQGPKYAYNRMPGGKDARGSVAYVYAGTMSDCVFRDSYIDSGSGAGVYLVSADAILEDSLLTNLYAVNGSENGSALTIVNGLARRCDISGNISRQNGPIAMNGKTARLFDSVITNNESAGVNPMWKNDTWSHLRYGGGVWIRNAGAVVSNCVIAANRANLPGGGVKNVCTGGGLVFEAAGKVYNTVIRNNSAYLEGGGVWVGTCGGYLYNCIIADNVSVAGTGGGVYGKAFLYNCTVTGNDSQLDGGVDGVDGSASNAKATVENGIVWGNGTSDTGANVILTSAFMEDPQFVDAAAGDYRLDICSSCIDTAGTPSVTLPETDAAGNPRVANGLIDYGALEAVPCFRIVGDPETFGVPATPAFGEHGNVAFGTVNCSVTSPYADASGLTNVVCTGFTYVARDNDNTVTMNEGAEASYAVAYARFGVLTWHLAVKYEQAAVTRGNGSGTVTGAGFVAKDEVFTLTAVPEAGSHFFRWEGDVGENDPTSPAITLKSDSAHKLTAVFGVDWYVATTGNDEASGSSEAPFKTIHKALSVAGDGDNVYVAAGRYGCDADHQALVVTNAVSLIGTGAKRTDVCAVYEGSTEKWSGFGGKRLLYVNNKLATVRHMDFAGPSSTWNLCGDNYGTTVSVVAGRLSDCVFRDGYVNAAYGSGVYLDTEDAVLEDSLLSGYGSAGGVWEGGVALTIKNGVARRCEIINNIGRTSGPVGLQGAKARLLDSIVTNNQSCAADKHSSSTWGGYRCGGGVWVLKAGAIVSNCVIAANRANKPADKCGVQDACVGGGLVFAAKGKVYNTVIQDNWSYLGGGGVYGEGTLFNCLIANNVSTNGQGGGVCGKATLVNCTVVGNDSQLDDGTDGLSGAATVSNGIVWGNGTKNYDSATMTSSCSTPLPAGQGNVSCDPQFRNAARGRYQVDSNGPVATGGVWLDALTGCVRLDGTPMLDEKGNIAMGCYAPYVRPGLMIFFR